MNEESASETQQQEEWISCYDCAVCKGKTKVYYVQNGEVVFRNCSCIPIRSSILKAKASGLGELLSTCKFSTFSAREAWQIELKKRAKAYAAQPEGWLMVSGKVGGGKTHICTAIVGRLIHSGMSARYMRWKDDSTELKGMINDPAFAAALSPFLTADVLYIDDFLKMPRGTDGISKEPGKGDLNLAFQMINNRYTAGKTTIISSEHTVDDIVKFDEAVGSRIYERTKNNCLIVPHDAQNYRLR